MTNIFTKEQSQYITNIFTSINENNEFYYEIVVEYDGEDYLITYYTPLDWCVTFGRKTERLTGDAFDFIIGLAKSLDMEYIKRVS